MRRTVVASALVGMFVLGAVSSRLVSGAQAADAPAAARVVNLLKMTDEELGAERPGTHMRSNTFYASPGATVSVQTGDVAKHFHQNSDEIQYIVEGHGTFWVGDHEQEVGPGDLIIIPEGHRARRLACDDAALQGDLDQGAAASLRRRASGELMASCGDADRRRARELPRGAMLSDAGAILDLLQWPAMVVTLAAAWLVASKHRGRRHWGFWLFVLSNALWIAWGWPNRSYGLIDAAGRPLRHERSRHARKSRIARRHRQALCHNAARTTLRCAVRNQRGMR